MSDMKFSKEVTNYGDNVHNYIVQDEILVTITLAEYRELVEFKAKHEPEIRALKQEKYRIEDELSKGKQRIADLILKYEKGEGDGK